MRANMEKEHSAVCRSALKGMTILYLMLPHKSSKNYNMEEKS